MIRHPADKILTLTVLIVGLVYTVTLDHGDNNIANKALPVQRPTFAVVRRHGTLMMSGHTLSIEHERSLRQVADRTFSGDTVTTDFKPLGILPKHWTDTTIQVVYLLAESSFANATLGESSISIRSVVTDDLAWKNRLAALRKSLPDGISVNDNATHLNADITAADVCERAFIALNIGPINFEESSDNFRSSAYPRLDRVVALAVTCRDSTISITGHTDASGSAAWNKQLSQRRAAVVGAYLAASGINPDRLAISGAGSTLPIADNATRYGRSLNRRIEINLQPGLEFSE